jgi:protein tyrosine phosphatase
MKLRVRYKLNKEAQIGEKCVCPSCGTEFEKSNKQQAFCTSKKGTKCKDKYWNTVTPNKRNNKTRISPASATFMAVRPCTTYNDDYDYDDEHIHSTGALGQWDD